MWFNLDTCLFFWYWGPKIQTTGSLESVGIRHLLFSHPLIVCRSGNKELLWEFSSEMLRTLLSSHWLRFYCCSRAFMGTCLFCWRMRREVLKTKGKRCLYEGGGNARASVWVCVCSGVAGLHRCDVLLWALCLSTLNAKNSLSRPKHTFEDGAQGLMEKV